MQAKAGFVKGRALQGTPSGRLPEAEVQPSSPTERHCACPTAEAGASRGKAFAGLNFADHQKCPSVGK